MKKYFVVLMLMGALAIMISGCSSTSGVSFTKKKSDLQGKGLNTVDGYNPTGLVFASDTLPLNGPLPADKVRTFKKSSNKKDYILPGGAKKLPKYVYQMKADKKTDMSWALGLVPDGNDIDVQTILLDSEKNKKSGKNSSSGQGAIAGEANTFDMYGTKIKATILNDTTKVDYRPCVISFFMTSDLPVKMIHYSYNNKDSKIYDLNNPDDFKSLGDRIYVKEINLMYGNRFSLITNDGKTPNISPFQVNEGNFILIGVELAENPIKTDPSFYVFRVVGWNDYGSDEDASAIAGESDNANNTGAGDYNSNIIFGKVRTADLSRYTNGYIRMEIKDIAQDAWTLFEQLANMKDANGERAIGLGKDGNLYPTVIVSPGFVKPYTVLFNKYKDRIQYPGN